MSSELINCNKPSSISLGPGSTSYLLSLARVALNASMGSPELWGSPELVSQLLQHLLEWPHYEVRELALERVLQRLQEEDLKRPEWLDQITQSHLTSLAFHETRPRSLARVRTHVHMHMHTHVHVFTFERLTVSVCLFCRRVCGLFVIGFFLFLKLALTFFLLEASVFNLRHCKPKVCFSQRGSAVRQLRPHQWEHYVNMLLKIGSLSFEIFQQQRT